MQTADGFLTEAMLAANGGRPPIYDEGVDPLSMLPWGDAPEARDIIEEYHPDKRNEPVIWTHRQWSPDGRVLCGMRLLVKKAFVEDCLAGNIRGVDNPRQWLWGLLVEMLVADSAIVV